MVIYLPKANFGYSICTYKFISKIKHSCVRNTIIVEYTANDRRLQMHNSLCINVQNDDGNTCIISFK